MTDALVYSNFLKTSRYNAIGKKLNSQLTNSMIGLLVDNNFCLLVAFFLKPVNMDRAARKNFFHFQGPKRQLQIS